MPILKLNPIWELGNTPSTRNSNISPGVAGNYETVKILTKVARERSRHPLVRELALRILESYGVKSQNYYDEAKAIGDFTLKNIRYVRDINGVETVHDPVMLIDQLRRGQAQGDCDDMALFIATLLLSIGHQPYYRIVKYYDGMGPYQHIYVVVKEQNWRQKPKRLVLDAILKRSPIGTEVPHKSGQDIKV